LTFNKCFTFLIILIFVFHTTLFSLEDKSKVSDKYKEVEQLIEILDYNQAINVLVEIVKQNPEEMEKAQKMIQEIRIKKEEFNKIYEELIRVLFVENDYDKGLALIDELEKLDNNPNPNTEDSLRDARISAELIYFRLLFNETMDRAYAFYLNGQYDEAVKTYLTGYNFHKRTYNERAYGDIIKGPVDQRLEALMDAAAEFLEEYSVMTSVNASPVNSITNENEQLLNEYEDLFIKYAALRNTVWHAGWTFRDQNALLGEISSEYKEDFFLSFAWRIVYGRSGVEQEEGLIVTMDNFWISKLVPLLAKLDQNLDSSVSRAEQAYRSKDWINAENNFEEGQYWTERAIDFYNLWTNIINLDSHMNLTKKSRSLINTYYNSMVDHETKRNYVELLVLLSQYNQRLESYAVYNNQDLALMDTRREIIKEEIANINPLIDEWDEIVEKISKDLFYTETESDLIVNVSLSDIREVQESYATLRGDLSLDMADLVLEPLEEEYQSLVDEQGKALAFLEGITENPEEDELSILYFYPERTLDILEQIQEENLQLQDEMADFIEEYRRTQNDIPQKAAIAVFILRAENILRGLQDAQQEYQRLNRRADQNITQAERFKNEGGYRLDEAENALRQKDFQLAVQNLTSAQDLYVQALSYNEDIVSRDDIDRRIAALQSRILQEENKEVILYVRNNVNEGKSLYLQGRYSQSEIVFLRAESRWFTTNTESNSEIDYWLNLVRAALSVESGRTIEDTEPLYAEMTQFLNLAFSNFEKGRALIAEGNVTDGLKYLDSADQNLNEILIPMPLNQAASVLKLRIQQLKDPDLFLVVFSEKYKSAVNKLKTEADVAYIDLKDLAEIEPNYPGISRSIYNAEIILGIRILPPDPAALRESKNLYNKAFVIVEGNVRSQFPVALAQLDKAIELNPENSAAIELKDRIQLDAGGQTTIVLSSAAQSQFKSAEEKYIDGNYFEAYAIVQQLLKNKNNAAYSPLQDLKRRIESKF